MFYSSASHIGHATAFCYLPSIKCYLILSFVMPTSRKQITAFGWKNAKCRDGGNQKIFKRDAIAKELKQVCASALDMRQVLV